MVGERDTHWLSVNADNDSLLTFVFLPDNTSSPEKYFLQQGGGAERGKAFSTNEISLLRGQICGT